LSGPYETFAEDPRMDLVARARNITLSPRSEWAAIAGEPADIGALYTGYIALLAAIPLLAELVHFLVLGLPIGIALRIGLRGYFSSMIEVAVVAFAAELLAPRFGGVANRGEAFKLAAFAFTPFWLGGVFLLLPRIGGWRQPTAVHSLPSTSGCASWSGPKRKTR
jgi:hypothetical protein